MEYQAVVVTWTLAHDLSSLELCCQSTELPVLLAFDYSIAPPAPFSLVHISGHSSIGAPSWLSQLSVRPLSDLFQLRS